MDNPTIDPAVVNSSPGQTSPQEELQKLQQIITTEDKPITHIKAVWPFDFFPNEVIVDKTKITIVRKYFFWTRQVVTLLVADILNVEVRHSILFGALVVADRFFAQDPFIINYLWKEDATKTASIIQGLVLAQKNNIDVQKIPSDQLAQAVEQVGMAEQGRTATAL